MTSCIGEDDVRFESTATGEAQLNTGSTPDGIPLSYHRQLKPELRPWFSRIHATNVAWHGKSALDCSFCNDTATLRLFTGAQWSLATKDGEVQFANRIYLVGPQSQAMPCKSTGPILVLGVSVRAGALHCLTGLHADTIVDRIESVRAMGLELEEFHELKDAEMRPDRAFEIIEGILTDLIERRQPRHPDAVTTAFDLGAFTDPNMSISGFAESHGIGVRQLERRIKRDFGLTPKQVLRRARALDLGAQLCGVADEQEAEEVIARYSDQSHLIREFTAFFRQTPKRFAAAKPPIMTMNLEHRQSRRLEELERLGPDDAPPWGRRKTGAQLRQP
ncbi:helix-turn-helix domain-containing protein [Qipengyuania sp. JC766]|uniref:helix-turn-helix domain-containing protein n=1 Tax=Qipengyuania sp. JC766 TaxID=3232139 RepID=UPI003459A833